ncbi:hypothetical protein [Alkalicoccobacillus plakortidis]|uniref:hypothetical protein n=1 Tax=Alkalicoccobacillus plakortidis TaxID=444060 RepID=UPI0027D95124|nr:hypothetical protein [Alkalicoccobacillus plakortidis]
MQAWKHSERLLDELGASKLQNVLREEALVINGKAHAVSFGERRIAELTKECLVESTQNAVKQVSIGQGTFIWSPLPVELNNRLEPLKELYRFALQQAGVTEELIWNKGGDNPGVYGRRLSFDDGDLYIFVSEFAGDVEVEVTNPVLNKTYSVKLEQERSVLFQTNAAGEIVTTYRPNEVQVESESEGLKV